MRFTINCYCSHKPVNCSKKYFSNDCYTKRKDHRKAKKIISIEYVVLKTITTWFVKGKNIKNIKQTIYIISEIIC